MLRLLLLLFINLLVNQLQALTDVECPTVALDECCSVKWSLDCVPRHCFNYVLKNCPERKNVLFGRTANRSAKDSQTDETQKQPQQSKCGTAETNYEPCTSQLTADKLFKTCCELYVPPECHTLCTYETDQSRSRNMLIEIIENGKCKLEALSSVLYCASQNRDNRACCTDLGLNSPQLQVGSRCLRMCDPSGTAIERIAKEDATCLFNWNVIMYCHHSGIREM
uniref:DB domain-containing protein n=1 Tax=Syphacia muris TaxID=451379 RepID=A0A0N5AW96_9BILA